MSVQSHGQGTKTVAFCPECGAESISKKKRNVSGRGANRQYPEDYQCMNCHEHFDSPEKRKATIDLSEFSLPSGFDLKMARRVRGISVSELAEQVEPSKPTIYRIESGEDVNIRYFREILAALREAERDKNV